MSLLQDFLQKLDLKIPCSYPVSRCISPVCFSSVEKVGKMVLSEWFHQDLFGSQEYSHEYSLLVMYDIISSL